jgi:hypothetical protein
MVGPSLRMRKIAPENTAEIGRASHLRGCVDGMESLSRLAAVYRRRRGTVTLTTDAAAGFEAIPLVVLEPGRDTRVGIWGTAKG